MSIYGFRDLRLDPPDDVIVTRCNCCGGEIYEGESYYNIDGSAVCPDCLEEFAKDYFKSCREEARLEPVGSWHN